MKLAMKRALERPTSPLRTQSTGLLVLATLAFPSLSACDRIFNTAETPESVCVSAEARETLQSLIVERDKTFQDSLGLPPRVEQHANRLWSRKAVTFELVTLESVDETTKKITCKGKFVVRLPSAKGVIEPNVKPFSEAPITFTRQPAAAGDGFIYGFEDPTESVTLIAAALATIRAEDELQSATPSVEADRADADNATSGEDEEVSYEEFRARFASPEQCAAAATSTNEQLLCSRMKAEEADARVAQALKAAIARLDPAQAAELKAAHAIWINRRDEECEAEGAATGGDFGAFAFTRDGCLIERSDARGKELARLGHTSMNVPQ